MIAAMGSRESMWPITLYRSKSHSVDEELCTVHSIQARVLCTSYEKRLLRQQNWKCTLGWSTHIDVTLETNPLFNDVEFIYSLFNDDLKCVCHAVWRVECLKVY